MLAGVFERKLRQLNKDLKVFCGDDVSKPAGIFRFKRSQYDELTGGYDLICGIDKNWVGEHAEFGNNGKLNRSGWRRVLRILIQQGLIDRRYAERVFCTHLPYAVRKLVVPISKPKRDLIERFAVKTGGF